MQHLVSGGQNALVTHLNDPVFGGCLRVFDRGYREPRLQDLNDLPSMRWL